MKIYIVALVVVFLFSSKSILSGIYTYRGFTPSQVDLYLSSSSRVATPLSEVVVNSFWDGIIPEGSRVYITLSSSITFTDNGIRLSIGTNEILSKTLVMPANIGKYKISAKLEIDGIENRIIEKDIYLYVVSPTLQTLPVFPTVDNKIPLINWSDSVKLSIDTTISDLSLVDYIIIMDNEKDENLSEMQLINKSIVFISANGTYNFRIKANNNNFCEYYHVPPVGVKNYYAFIKYDGSLLLKTTVCHIAISNPNAEFEWVETDRGVIP